MHNIHQDDVNVRQEKIFYRKLKEVYHIPDTIKNAYVSLAALQVVKDVRSIIDTNTSVIRAEQNVS
jgi:hypothetical protein